MTRRKRTPPPSLAGRFAIPASLQQLSALSASLARSADAPVEKSNSEIVRLAMARVAARRDGAGEDADGESDVNGDAAVNGEQDGGAEGDGEGKKRTRKWKKKKKPVKGTIRWKTTEHVFPEEQTWVKPSGRNPVAEGHLAYLKRRMLEGSQEQGVVRAGTTNGGRVETSPGWPRVQSQSNGSTPAAVMGSDVWAGHQRLERSYAASPSTFSNNPPTAGMQTTFAAAMPVASDSFETNQSLPRKRPRVAFIERHQRDFPTNQTWLTSQRKAAAETKREEAAAAFPEEIVKRRAFIIAQLRQTHNPVAIVGADRVMDDSSVAGRGPDGVQVVVQQPRSVPVVPMSSKGLRERTNYVASLYDHGQTTGGGDAGDGGGGGDEQRRQASQQQAQIEALVAQKRAENVASGQVNRLLHLKEQHRRREIQQSHSNGGTMMVSYTSGPYPLLRPQTWERGKGNMGRAMGARYVGKGEMVRNGPMRNGAVSVAEALPASVPLQGLAETARAVMETSKPQVLDGIAEAAAADEGVVTADADTDEDAPGEDDTPDPGSTSAVPRPYEHETVVESVEVQEATASATDIYDPSTNGTAVPSLANRLIDPGDLRSLFSSPGPSSRGQSIPIVAGGRQKGNGAIDAIDADGHNDINGEDHADDNDDNDGLEEDEDEAGPASPSAQLLMALANATTPPPVSTQPDTRKNGLGGAEGGEHRSTRSGLVLSVL